MTGVVGMCAAVAAAALLVAGCGGGSSGGGDDLKTYSEDGLSISYPAGWKVDQQGDGGARGLRLSAHGPRDGDGLFARVTVQRQRKQFASAAQFGGVLKTRRPFELQDGRSVRDGSFDVPGADGAWRVVTDFSTAAKSGKRVPAEITELVAMCGDEQFLVSVGGPKADLEDVPVDRILGSLKLGDAAG